MRLATQSAPRAAPARRVCVRAYQALAEAPAYESQAAVPQQTTARAFANFTIYKGKAALALRVIKPSWQRTVDGDFRLAKAGGVLLELAPAVGGTGNQPGERRYNWSEGKQTFALSAVELGTLIDPPPEGIKDLFHDPMIGSSAQGHMTKSLGFKPMPNEAGGWYLSLSVREGRGQAASMGVPITRGEYAVMRSLAQHVIPHILGWDVVLDQRLPSS
ncbi:hypothetical protein WJX81_007431 [Elliptochloris bilobata]|uniref:Uncharacterized protein n=1 Tax=Elliptochloris bilobata TaxID=381761 RepID=A0AAW1RJC3_9CHLO